MNSPFRWKVHTIDLTAPLPKLRNESGYSGIWAIFFANGVALGHTQIPATDLPMEPSHLAMVASRAVSIGAGDRALPEGFHSATPGLPVPPCRHPVDALQALVDLEDPLAQITVDPPAPNLSITVAICTRERPYPLERCLRSLAASTLAPRQILVIDNAPVTDDTRKVVDKFPGVAYYCEPRPGLSAARNAALAQATTDIVAFIDDDVAVHPEWLRRILGCFEDPSVLVATGLVLPAEIESESQLLFEKTFQFFNQGYRRRRFDAPYFKSLRNKGVPVWEIGAGANMAIRRSAYDLGFCFDVDLGPGVFGGCGEDSEFWYRILAEGGTCLYEPAACVYHYHRREDEHLRQLLHEYMKGHVAALILQYSRYRHRGNLRRLLLELPAEYVVLLLRAVSTGFSKDCRLLLRSATGCFAGLLFAFSRRAALLQRP